MILWTEKAIRKYTILKHQVRNMEYGKVYECTNEVVFKELCAVCHCFALRKERFRQSYG